MLRVLVIILLLFPLCASAQWHHKTFNVMGTQASVEFWLDATIDDDKIANGLISQVEAEMNRIDQLMSPYIASSEISKINQLSATQSVTISTELFSLLKEAQTIAELTDGAFDITFASVGYQYDYRNNIKPSAADISSSLKAIDYQSLILQPDSSSVTFKDSGVKIDLGGIAKGHAVKQCIALLSDAGIKHALVSAGGDTSLLGDRAGRPWFVGIKHPRAADKTAVHIPLINESISTSGDYERYFIEDGIRFHHIINPKTGDSAREVVSVSIIGTNATFVDALSTAVFVKGLAQGMAFINGLDGYEAIIIDNQQTMHMSQGLQTN